MEESNREDRIEAVVLERKPTGIAAEELDAVGGGRRAGLLAPPSDHRFGNIEPDDVCAALCEHHAEAARAAGDLEESLALDRAHCLEYRSLLTTIDQAAAPREPFVLVGLGDGICLVPLPALHGQAG